MAKKTGIKLGLKNLGIESGGEATGLEEIFGLASAPETTSRPRRGRRQATADTGPVFGEIDILAVRPDPDQPRTLLPINGYRALDQGASPIAVLTDWLGQASAASLAQQEEMREIKSLAQTIQTAGLQQPIGIREVESTIDGVTYAVVFGERRWWAHVYLLSADNNALGQDVGKIRAGLVQPSNLQLVQLIENLHRRNLPPLDLAMGLQTSFDQLKAAGVKHPWQQIEQATGIGRAQRSRYLHLLELAPSVQQIIRDYMLTENAVRPIADKLRKQPESVQLNAIQRLIAPAEEKSPPNKAKSGSGGMSSIASNILKKSKAAGKTLSKLDDGAIDQFRIYLQNEPRQAAELVALRNRLNQVLADVVPGQLFLVQTNGGILELSAENAAAGYLAFESYLEAAAEGGEVLEYAFDDAMALASADNMVLWVAGTDGEVRQA